MTSQLREVLISLGPHKDGLLFDIPVITLRRYFDRALIAAKISDFWSHALRHTFASHFVMRTGDLPALQQILGHYSLKMTQRYAHLAKSHVASRMQLFASAIPTASPATQVEGAQRAEMNGKNLESSTNLSKIAEVKKAANIRILGV